MEADLPVRATATLSGQRLQTLIDVLIPHDFQVRGLAIRYGAIVHGEIAGVADLPVFEALRRRRRMQLACSFMVPIP